ncbi:UNVERIFIED_CONTAM: hypothetical protein GTU68_030220, partial [Idotea baltica]|nr:hypothetical protein [Idotea baltica]
MIAGNWKMNLTFDEARRLFHELINLKYDPKAVEVLIAPPALYLSPLAIANSSDIIISAQNCHQETSGAYTGEWSAEMLASVRVDHCIIGHSERRALFNETDQQVAQKAKACFEHNIVPIVCCGETLEERKSSKHFDRVTAQLDAVITDLSAQQMKRAVIAYEPVWAIGTGETASSGQAQEMHEFIRKFVTMKFDHQVANEVRI